MNDVDRALAVLRAGGLVAIPTETVYGLAADASNPEAVRRIFAVKRRPADHPLIVHIADQAEMNDWAAILPDAAVILADACWPGPLTLLVPRGSRVLDDVTGGRSTVGLRVPAHPLTLELLHRFGGGLAAPSANRFGRVSPTTADHVRADLGDEVDFVFDGGPCPIGVESTIVDCTVDPPQVLRPGAITADEVAALLQRSLGARGRAESRARHARIALRPAVPRPARGRRGRGPLVGRVVPLCRDDRRRRSRQLRAHVVRPPPRRRRPRRRHRDRGAASAQRPRACHPRSPHQSRRRKPVIGG